MSIAAGTALISHLSYRVLLLAVVGVVGAAPEPAAAPEPNLREKRFRGNVRPG